MNAFSAQQGKSDRVSARQQQQNRELIHCILFQPPSVTVTMPQRPRRQRGLTLVELIVTFAVFAVLVSLAVPTFSPLIARWQRDNVTGALSTSLQQARSESIKSARKVVICPSDDPSADTPTCLDDNEWKDGWLVFVDADSDNDYDSSKGDRLISTRAAASGVESIVSQTTDPDDDTKKDAVKYLVFLPIGLLGNELPGKIKITVTPTNTGVNGNELDINQIGRVTVSTLS
jgi:type IV fimbrial biogenesis protein FimT